GPPFCVGGGGVYLIKLALRIGIGPGVRGEPCGLSSLLRRERMFFSAGLLIHTPEVSVGDADEVNFTIGGSDQERFAIRHPGRVAGRLEIRGCQAPSRPSGRGREIYRSPGPARQYQE